jgi:hypothetical protein
MESKGGSKSSEMCSRTTMRCRRTMKGGEKKMESDHRILWILVSVQPSQDWDNGLGERRVHRMQKCAQ